MFRLGHQQALPPKGKDLECATAPRYAPNSTGDASNPVVISGTNDLEWQDLQKSRALLYGVAVLTILQVITHIFTRKLYAKANKEPPLYEEVRFYVGLLVSVALLVASLVTRCCYSCCGIGTVWRRLIGGLAAWSGLHCVVIFGAMVRSFPHNCTFYNATGASGDESITFTHIDCPRIIGDIPARVVTTCMGHIYAVAAIGILGGLTVMKPRLSPFIPRVAIDFVDLQDFALLLIDDEILKTFWGQAEGGYGGEWLWWLLFVNVIFATLSMFGELIFNYKATSYADMDAKSGDEHETWDRIDNIVNCTSLGFVEIPFLVMRTYTSFRFDVPPSSLILKNIASICKEVSELYYQRHLRLGFYGAVFGAEEK